MAREKASDPVRTTLPAWDESEPLDPVLSGTIEILDHQGDTKQKWDRNNLLEVEAARTLFTTLTGQGYAAFHAHAKTGEREGRMTAFEPAAEGMILVPPIAGGCTPGRLPGPAAPCGAR